LRTLYSKYHASSNYELIKHGEFLLQFVKGFSFFPLTMKNKNIKTPRTLIVTYFMWVWKLVSHIEGEAVAEADRKYDFEEDTGA